MKSYQDTVVVSAIDAHNASTGRTATTATSQEKPQESLGKGAFRQVRFTAWRQGASVAALAVVVSLSVNIAMAILLKTFATFDSGIGTLFRGSCDRVSQYNLWVHVGVNIIATLLLTGSNYAMQCFAAPTRSDIDRAHAKGKWLDIGVPSVRNLKYIPRWKVVMWSTLLASSLPIYLLYNSVFYMSLVHYDYNVYVTNEAFIQRLRVSPPGAIDVRRLPTERSFDGYYWDFDSSKKKAMTEHLLSVRQNLASFERLERADCMRAYKQEFLNDHRTLFLVSDDINLNATTVHAFEYLSVQFVNAGRNVYLPYNWICLGPQSKAGKACWEYVDELIASASREWVVSGFPVRYCLAEKVEQLCSLNASFSIAITVATCNLIKLVVMLVLIFGLPHPPIMTVGDAIASFLQRPDQTTRGLCCLSRKAVATAKTWPQRTPSTESSSSTNQCASLGRTQSWFAAISRVRAFWTVFLVIGSLIVAGSFLGLIVGTVQTGSQKPVFSYGFGKINAVALATNTINDRGDGSTKINLLDTADHAALILGTVVLANLPQLIFSLNYFSLNALVTIVYLAKEWNNYSVRYKPLRVSVPQGVQRSTYFLSLPYRAAVPLILYSGLMHWLISQSVFLAVVAGYDAYGNLRNPTQITTLGFSPLPALITFVAVVLLLFAILFVLFRRFTSVMPVVGSCSVAIAAACHGPTNDPDSYRKPLMWKHLQGSDSDQNRSCHYFTSCPEGTAQGQLLGRQK